METFDLVVMGVGGLLITAGCVLFVTGKVAGSHNQIEAFGIKMDVNNPSLLLLATGIGLLLVPRLLPARRDTPPSLVAVGVPPGGHAGTPTPATDEIPRPTPPASSEAPPAPSIAGNYVLLSATENGVLTHVQAVLAISEAVADRYAWYSVFQVYDQYAGAQTFEYSGEMARRGAAWAMVILASNDPHWYGRQQIPLQLAVDEETLELNYVYNGARIVSLWERQ